jgi:hypothetical protein
MALSSCGTPTAHLYYKIIVEVDTPSGLKTGSAVREVKVMFNDGWINNMFQFGGRQTNASVRGEAVAVDIAPGKTLFALMNGASGDADYSAHVPEIARPDLFDHREFTSDGQHADESKIYPYMRESKVIAELWPSPPLSKWRGQGTVAYPTMPVHPMLVRFRDVRDPMTVEAVDPDHLDASFGAGVKLRRITVQITDDPVTSGIEKRLGWLPNLHGSYLDGGTTGDAQNNGMHGGYFSTELFK